MKIIDKIIKSGMVLLSTTCLCSPYKSYAQSIPLDIIREGYQPQVNGPPAWDYRLGINVGVNGGKPVEYLFDTGSDSFNIDVGNGPKGPSWFPLNVGTTPVANLTPYMYGDGTYGYLLYNTTVSSVQFYSSSSGDKITGFQYDQGIPVAAAPYYIGTINGLNGDQPGVQINNPTLTSYGFTTDPYYQDLTWQNAIDAGQPPEEGAFYGIFGAGDFGKSLPGMFTSSGYIVEANGTSTTPGQCGRACMILGLTPSLRAQFFSVNPWIFGATGKFLFSNANSSQEFETFFTYTLANSAGKASATMLTLLDSGTPNIALHDTGLLSTATALGIIDQSTYDPGSVATGTVFGGLKISYTGYGNGNQNEALTTGDPYSGDATNVINLTPSDLFTGSSAINGISFYFHNSVMYDLQNKATAYTPFYVTNDPVSTSITITSDMGPVGFANIISGSKPLTVDGGGIAFLTAANTYTGSTEIHKGGWLGVGGPGWIGNSKNVAVDGTFDVSHSAGAQPIQSLSGNGLVVLGQTTLTLTNASGTFSGSLQNFYPSEDRTLVTPYPMTFGPEIAGTSGGLIVAGGKETLAGQQIYSGATGIGGGGALVLNGTLPNSSVANAGYFENNGQVGGETLSTGYLTGTGNFAKGLFVRSGLVAPGQSGVGEPTTLTVGQSGGSFLSANMAFGTDATYVVTTAGSASSLISVDGKALLGGAGVVAKVGAETQKPVLGQSYTILTATQGLTGKFGALESNLTGPVGLFPFLSPGLAYDVNDVMLQIGRSRIPFAAAAQTMNEYAVAHALDGVDPFLPLPKAITGLTFASARPAFDSLSGEIHAAARTALLQNAQDVRDASVQRLRMAACAPGSVTSGIQVATLKHGQFSLTHDTTCHSERRALWMQSYGEWSHNDQTANTHGLSSSTGGFILGGDTPVKGGWHVGGLFAYGHSSFHLSQMSSGGHSNDITLGAYGGREWRRLGLRLGGSYTWNLLSTQRDVGFPGFADHASARYTAGTGQIFGDLGYRLAYRALMVEPFINLAYVHLQTNPYSENGGAAALHGYGESRGLGYGTFGGRLATRGRYRGIVFQPNMSLGYRHVVGTVTPSTRESFMFGSGIFRSAGVPLMRSGAALTAGLSADATRRVNVSLSYMGQYGRRFTASGVNGGVKIAF